MAQYIRCEIDDAVAHVTLDRPEVANAINASMRDEIVDCMVEINSTVDVRAVVMTGAGHLAFSSGQDLEEAAGFEGEAVASWARHQGELLRAVRALDKPLVVGFNGMAAGMGFQLGLLADLRIGYPAVQVGQPEVRVGVASVYGSYLMSLHVGLSHNQELSMTGGLISGTRAHEIGLINRLVDKDAVCGEALAAALRFANLPTLALSLTKERFREQTQAGFDAACEAAVECQKQAYATGGPQRIMLSMLAERQGSGAKTAH